MTADPLEPVRRAGAHGVWGDTDTDAAGAQLLDLCDVRSGRFLAEAGETAAGVRREQERELDRRLLGRLDRRERLVEAQVVEFPNRGVTGVSHLRVRSGIGP